MKQAIKNVETELKNAEHLTQQKVKLAPLWKTFMREHLNKVRFEAQTYMNARIGHAETEIRDEIKRLRLLEKSLLRQEKGPKAATHKATQAKKEKDLKAKLTPALQAEKTQQTKVTTLEKQKEILMGRLAGETNAQKKKTLSTQNKAKGKELTTARAQLQTKTKQVGLTRRKLAELYSGGVQNVVKNFQKDQRRLAAYKKVVATMKMPAVA